MRNEPDLLWGSLGCFLYQEVRQLLLIGILFVGLLKMSERRAEKKKPWKVGEKESFGKAEGRDGSRDE